MRSVRSVSVLVLLGAASAAGAFVACGGSTATIDPAAQDKDGGANTDGGGGGDAGVGSIEGSFDLSFAEITPTFEGGGPVVPPSTPPSLAKKARLDVRANPAGGYDAVFTSRWGTSSSLAVAVSATAVTLTGTATVRGDAGGSGLATDTWRSLTLARDASGKLTGAVTGTGEETINQGDVLWSGKLTGKGSIAIDATRPELRARASSAIGPADAILPWDAIVVEAAEPVAGAGLRDATQVKGPSGPSIPVGWVAQNAAPWAGETTASARMTDWAAASSAKEITVANDGAKAFDLVALTSPALSTKVKVHPVAFVNTSVIDFQGDVLLASPWGDVAFYGGGITGTPDPRCESGGCARLGPVSLNGCTAQRVGLAGQLAAGANGHVELRYRVLALPDGGSSPNVFGDVLTMELARPGGSVERSSVLPSQIKLDRLASAVDGMTHGTPWSTLDVLAPSGSGAIGVAVAPGGRDSLCGGPLPPAVKVEILVQKIASK